MKFIHRLGYYSGGLIIGLMMMFFILSGKNASCDYSANARTLKNIRSKDLVISDISLIVLSEYRLDTSVISTLLLKGEVIFSESNTKLDSCKVYVIKGTVSEMNLKIKVENCNKKATVLETRVLY